MRQNTKEKSGITRAFKVAAYALLGAGCVYIAPKGGTPLLGLASLHFFTESFMEAFRFITDHCLKATDFAHTSPALLVSAERGSAAAGTKKEESATIDTNKVISLENRKAAAVRPNSYVRRNIRERNQGVRCAPS